MCAKCECRAKVLKLLNKAEPTQEILTLNSYDAFMKTANRKATKIIIP